MNAPQIVKERPILFSGPMVRAILDGRKTQTRRVIKPQPEHKQVHDWKGERLYDGEHRLWWWEDQCWDLDVEMLPDLIAYCPYGEIGDRPWVRETWFNPDYQNDGRISEPTYYRATDDPDEWLWRPSIHMPRWASRIDLEITDVRVERVQEITDYDCCMEGVPVRSVDGAELKDDFSRLWDSINLKRGYGWEVNPFCWCLTFKRIRP